MQSLGQAVYRFVCMNSKKGMVGVREESIIEEMASRGYLEPLRERVHDALTQNLTIVSGSVRGPDIVRIRGYYFQKRAYLKLHK